MMRIIHYLAIILGAVALCLSIAQADWTWFVLSAMSLVVLLLPSLTTRDFRKSYHEKIEMLYPIPYVAYLILSAIDFSGYLEDSYVYAYIIQTFAAMVTGMMLMIAVSHSGRVMISKRWILLLSISFACAFSVLCTFMVYSGMVEGGWPVNNNDFIDIDNTLSNRHLMLPPFIATFASLIYGYALRCLFNRIPKAEIGLYYEVA